MPTVCPTHSVCRGASFKMPVWRGQDHLPPLSDPLLQSADERPHKDGHEIFRPANDIIPPAGRNNPPVSLGCVTSGEGGCVSLSIGQVGAFVIFLIIGKIVMGHSPRHKVTQLREMRLIYVARAHAKPAAE